MSSKKYRGKVCVYCGNPSEDADHIPPKTLFAQANRQGLVKVPSCKPCNRGFSKDDEYFRIILTLSEDFDKHPDGAEIIDNVKRAFTNPEKQKFVESFRRTLRYANRLHPLGLYTGHVPVIRIDLERLSHVVKRIVKGLNYHERGVRLPEDCKVAVKWEFDFRDDPGKEGQTYRKQRDHVLSCVHRTIGDHTFSYWFSFSEDSEDISSVWYLRFYERVSVLGIADASRCD